MTKIMMYNPTNQVKIEVTSHFKNKWEELGFIEITNIVLLTHKSVKK